MHPYKTLPNYWWWPRRQGRCTSGIDIKVVLPFNNFQKWSNIDYLWPSCLYWITFLFLAISVRLSAMLTGYDRIKIFMYSSVLYNMFPFSSVPSEASGKIKPICLHWKFWVAWFFKWKIGSFIQSCSPWLHYSVPDPRSTPVWPVHWIHLSKWKI